MLNKQAKNEFITLDKIAVAEMFKDLKNPAGVGFRQPPETLDAEMVRSGCTAIAYASHTKEVSE